MGHYLGHNKCCTTYIWWGVYKCLRLWKVEIINCPLTFHKHRHISRIVCFFIKFYFTFSFILYSLFYSIIPHSSISCNHIQNVIFQIICLVSYISVTTILTLMVPYFEIHGDSALIDMFGQNGAPGIGWVVAIGAVSALSVSLLGSMFPMPRVIYAMSRDGLLFE